MKKLGRVLRTKRESLGLSLDDVQEKTKIRKRYLLALENGEWSVLPGNIYGRGFVRSYAELLGLDGLELLHLYVDAPSQEPEGVADEARQETTRINQSVESKENQATDPIVTQAEVERHGPSNVQSKPVRNVHYDRVPSKTIRLLSGRKFNGLSQIAVVVGVLVIIGGGLYVLKHNGTSTGPPSSSSTATGTVQNQSTSASEGYGNAPTSNASVNATTSATNGNQVTTGNVAGSSPPAQATGTASIIPATFQNNVQNYSVVASGPMTLTLKAASGDCWVSVRADNRIADSSDMINQGIEKSWTATQALQIRVGNVSVVQMQLNGQPVPLPATTNAIDVIFTRQ